MATTGSPFASRRSAPATTTQSLYLGTITATAPSLLPLVFLPALSGFFYFQGPGITLDALLVNQPDGPEPFTDYR